MDRANLFLLSLFNSFHPGKVEPLLHFLPADTQKSLQTYASIPLQNYSLALPTFEPHCSSVHYSWLITTLDMFPAPLRPAIISALSTEQQEGLVRKGYVTQNELLSDLSPPLRQFLLHLYYEKWPEKDICPKELLAHSALLPLLHCSKQELVELCDLLPMYDIAPEIRHVVDKKLLAKIMSALSKNQQRFVRTCIHTKSKPLFPSINLKEAIANPKSLRNLLHKRGLQRLTVALSGCEKPFLWHLCHIFDIGRGNFIMKEWKADEIPSAGQMAATQVIQIIQMFQPKEAT